MMPQTKAEKDDGEFRMPSGRFAGMTVEEILLTPRGEEYLRLLPETHVYKANRAAR